MIGQRIKRLRKAHGESQEELGKALGRDRSVVSKWENGQVDVDLELAGKVAKHYGVSLVDVLDLESEATGKPAPTGMSEDLLPFEPNQGDPLAGIKLSANQYRFTVATDVLSNIGIHSGDVVVVDDSATAVASVTPMQAVQVNWVDPVDGKSKLLLRQFIPPRLLITNGSSNQPSIDMGGTTDAHIVAVIVTAHRSFKTIQ